MWDVVWTDPERKSRKEHRERKADKNSKKPRSDPVFNAPRSISSRSSTSASSFNGAFLAVSPGRKRAQRNLVPPSPTLSSVPTSPTSLTSTHLDDGASIFSVGSESTPTISNYSPPSIYEKYLHPERPDFVRSISSLSARVEAYIDSSDTINASYLAPPRTASQIPQITERVALEPHHLVQTLSDDSFITRSTEVTTTTRSSGDLSMAISTKVIITAQSDSKKPERPMSPSTQSQSSGALKILRRVTSSNSSLRQEPRDAWQPPNAWICKPVSESSPSATEDNTSTSIEDSSSSDSSSGFSLNLESLRQELEHLSVENNHVRLLRLTRVWETLSGSPRRDLNVEQIQWILSALNNMSGSRPLSTSGRNSEESMPNRTSKILALFESPAVTSYLAGVHSEKQVYHLSSAPLSHTLFPNIHPVAVPGKTVSAFPLAPALFEAIYSFRLPAVVASQEIPSVLKNVHRCLQPGGSFHLTIIDPLPLVSSLGPLLRSWIEQHLLINLETSFCCTNPSRLMPIWLKNASLQVDGSRTLVTKFSAISSDEEQLIDAINVDGEEKVIDQELRNMIGRMAWMEIWKDYITADQWWWEDSSIVEECTKLGTAWEYHEIIASKC